LALRDKLPVVLALRDKVFVVLALRDKVFVVLALRDKFINSKTVLRHQPNSPTSEHINR